LDTAFDLVAAPPYEIPPSIIMDGFDLKGTIRNVIYYYV
jgi:hypothetical protein